MRFFMHISQILWAKIRGANPSGVARATKCMGTGENEKMYFYPPSQTHIDTTETCRRCSFLGNIKCYCLTLPVIDFLWVNVVCRFLFEVFDMFDIQKYPQILHTIFEIKLH